MKVYLSGPMDRVSLGEAKGWRERAKALAPEIEWVDPTEFGLEGASPREIVVRDLDEVDRSDALLAYVPDGVQTVGTIVEIYCAAADDLRVIVWGTADPSPWLVYLADAVCLTLEEAVEALRA